MSVDNENKPIVQQILHTFITIVETHDKYPVAQHLSAILRRKNTTGKEFFHWSDKELLNRLEKYQEEIDTELIMNDTSIVED